MPRLKLFYALVVLVLFCFVVSADELPLVETRGELRCTIRRGNDGGIMLQLEALAAGNAQVFWFDKPHRLIVDLPFEQGAPDWYKRVTIDDSPIVSGIRVGSHATKMRFVFDLLLPAEGAYQVRKEAGRVIVLLGSQGTIDSFIEQSEEHIQLATTPDKSIKRVKPVPTLGLTEVVKVTPTIKLKPKVTKKATATPTVTITPSPTSTVRLAPSKTPTPIAEEAEPTSVSLPAVELNPMDIEKPHKGRVSLRALGFEVDLEARRSLKLKFSKAIGYQLLRRSSSLYVLVIEDAEPLSKELLLPHFPPKAYEGFVSVRAQYRKGTIEVFIYIEDGRRLLSLPYGSEVWLRIEDS